MELIKRYLVVVYVIPEKVEAVLEAVKKIDQLKYGNYEGVHFKSAAGIEYYRVLQEAEPDQIIDETKVYQHETIKVEFSIDYEPDLLEQVLAAISEVHPWKEPVIRVIEVQETRA